MHFVDCKMLNIFWVFRILAISAYLHRYSPRSICGSIHVLTAVCFLSLARLPPDASDTIIPAILSGSPASEIFGSEKVEQRLPNSNSSDSGTEAKPSTETVSSEEPTKVPSEDASPEASAEARAEQKEEKVANETVEQDAEKNATKVDKTVMDLNLTVEEDQIPVFSEWAQKRLEEVEKQVEQETVNTSTMKKNAPTVAKAPVLKLKSAKNYASPDCGAKIIAANAESSGTGQVLTSNRDEYLLSPCKSRIWFVVELCEAIQAERIDLANFELFSSSPKNFSVGVGNRFPTRDWSNVGRFEAKDERYVQSFDLHPHLFGKYIRVDIHSHYNSEHFCPISLFRVYGTSEFEAFETENRQHPMEEIDDDEDDDLEATGKEKSNIFKSASDAVISIVKKTASFLNPQENRTSSVHPLSGSQPSHSHCITPNFVPTCTKCSRNLSDEVNALLQCKHAFLTKLLNVALIRNSLFNSQLCANLVGPTQIDCRRQIGNVTLFDLQTDYVFHLFPLKYITAMCNLLAAVDRKISLNSTLPMDAEASTNITIDKKAREILPGKRQKLRSELPSGKIPIALEGQVRSAGKEAAQTTEGEHTTAGSESTTQEEPTKGSSTEEAKATEQTASTEHPAVGDGDSKKSQNIFNVEEKAPESEGAEVQGSGMASSAEEASNATQTEQPAATNAPDNGAPTSAELNDATDEHTTAPQFGQKLHSESVFLRLSNRVKVSEDRLRLLPLITDLIPQALERNMSLSGQYLEELSRRYKRQVEELQMSFAKALLNIEEQSKASIERKQELFEQNQKLREDLEMLTKHVFSWRNIVICCTLFFLLQIFLFYVVLRLYTQKYFPRAAPAITSDELEDLKRVGTSDNRRRKSGNVSVKVRRKSAEEKRQRSLSTESSSLQRRPSTEALKITGTYEELLIKNDDDVANENDIQEFGTQNRKRLKMRSQNGSKRDDANDGFVRIEDLKQMYDKPALSDDYEIYGPENGLANGEEELREYDDSESTVDSTVDVSPERKMPQRKLTAPAGNPAKAKLLKNKSRTRRLSSPSFFKAPFSSPKAGAEQTTGWEWHRMKKSTKSSHNNNGKKSKSESPDSRRFNGLSKCSFVSSNSERSRNGNDSARSSLSSSNDSARKEITGFRRFIKKIF